MDTAALITQLKALEDTIRAALDQLNRTADTIDRALEELGCD